MYMYVCACGGLSVCRYACLHIYVHVQAHLCADMQVHVEVLGMEAQMAGAGHSLCVFEGYTQSTSCWAVS